MLRLRPYAPEDAKEIVKWLKDERSFHLWCADQYDSYPLAPEVMQANYEAKIKNSDFFPMTVFDEAGVAGHLIMRFVDAAKKVLRFGFIIISDTRRGKGYGQEMLKLALKYAFEILKVEKVTLGVFEKNPSAHKCYRSVGFKETSERVSCRILGEEWTWLEMAKCAIDQDTFESEYCFVTYKRKDDVVYLQWKQFASFENYRRPTTFALELLRKYPGSMFVIDARNGFEDEKEDVAWGFNFLLPEMARVGCKKVGMIMQEVNAIEGEMDMWSQEFKKYFSVVRATTYEALLKLR